MKILNEDYNIADPKSRKKIAARAVDLIRVSKLAREASVRAQNENKLDLAQKLNKRADELELLTKNIHIDKLDDEENNKEKEVKNSSANKDIQKETPESTSELEKTEKDQNGKDSEEDSKASENDSKEDQTNSENDSKENSKKEPNNSENDSKENSKEDQTNSENDSKENSKESKEEEPKDSEDDDAPIINPFMDGNENEVIPTKHSGKQPRDATIDDLYEILNALPSEARRGAIAALDDILANKAIAIKQESLSCIKLHESKAVQEMSDDEFADLLNSTLDLIDKIEKPEYIDDKEKRITKIKAINANNNANRELTAEDGVELAKDFQKVKAREQEAQKYTHYRAVDQFKINFYNSIKDQVEQVRREYQSYKEINPEYEDEGVVIKADVTDYIPDTAKPVINLYFDVSGSWTGNKYAIELGKQIVATIKEFEDNNEIILNVFYFGNDISTDMTAAGVWGSGTSAWYKILQNIKATKAKNIVLMTDLDMENQAAFGPVCKVDGDVWIIWNLAHDAAGGKEIPEHLIGRGSNLQYAFN